jgi:hypothetical protein
MAATKAFKLFVTTYEAKYLKAAGAGSLLDDHFALKWVTLR